MGSCILRFLLFTSLLVLSLNHATKAQFERTGGKIVADKKPGGIIETYNLEKSDITEGNFFINADWNVGDVTFKDGRQLEKVPLKYNLKDDLLHVLDTNDDVRVIQSGRISHFEWFNFTDKKMNRFINAGKFKPDGVPLVGVAELLAEGKATLINYRILVIQKANYSLIHDAGQKYDEFDMEEIFYVAQDEQLYRIKNKKSLQIIFAGREEDIKNFIRKNGLSVKNPEDLTRIIKYYNSSERN